VLKKKQNKKPQKSLRGVARIGLKQAQKHVENQ
jgi:hypothetical protein